jgi:formylglycine-generating enzyme required for sulfatase activity
LLFAGAAFGVDLGVAGAVKQTGRERAKKIASSTPTPTYTATPMILVPAGTFSMGDAAYATPVHSVYLDAFYMDKYEVTFDQYDAFCGATGRTKPSDYGWGRGTRPVMNITWNDSKAFCEWAGKRLPTEAEWERACRAGTNTAYSFGDDAGLLGTYAWYSSNSGNMTHPVGEKSPNALGLYDMHGNVWEWVADWYDSGYYAVSPLNNPPGPASGTCKVLRGGSWYGITGDLRSAFRPYFVGPGGWCYFLGCRCARTP